MIKSQTRFFLNGLTIISILFEMIDIKLNSADILNCSVIAADILILIIINIVIYRKGGVN